MEVSSSHQIIIWPNLQRFGQICRALVNFAELSPNLQSFCQFCRALAKSGKLHEKRLRPKLISAENKKAADFSPIYRVHNNICHARTHSIYSSARVNKLTLGRQSWAQLFALFLLKFRLFSTSLPKLAKPLQNWPNLCNVGQTSAKLAKPLQKWQKLCKFGLTSAKLA